jgi:FKBP-type peptidyl-prolyl cis-trans isomerase 2
MKNSKGEVLEDNLGKDCKQYLHGTGNILPALEANLAGLKAGDKKFVYISKQDGINDLDDDFSFEVIIDNVRAATEEELQRGSPIPNKAPVECGPGCNC